SVKGVAPRIWAERAVAACLEFGAARIVVEANQGGDMAKAVIAAVDPQAPVKTVHARLAKRLRAAPVAALYEQGLVRHVGAFSALEDEMTSFVGAGDASPDRLDALVWAITDLLLSKRSIPAVRAL
ncbi:MAG: DNA-packaging protein, partial [Parvularculaceae bacterium]|nr:DNA-packaging protein [Parvularculaceae bacterium]